MDLGSIDMSEVEKIMSSLSNEDMEMLGSMASQLFSQNTAGEKNEHNEKREKEDTKSKFENSIPNFGDIPIDFETIKKISAIMSKLNSRQNDERCEFLQSLRPMLSKPRQQKIDSAITMLRLFSLLPLMDELK